MKSGLGAVLGVTELLLIGSQAVHASMAGPLPIEATRSVKVDVAARGDVEGRLANLIDGSIGEASMFHDSFGYYAQGVVEATARLAVGWQARLVPFDTPGTCGVTAWCLELHDHHDLWVSRRWPAGRRIGSIAGHCCSAGWSSLTSSRSPRMDRRMDRRVNGTLRSQIQQSLGDCYTLQR